MKYKEKDILFYNKKNNEFDGDIRITNGDIKIANPEESVKQEVYNRLKTNNPDWYRHYNLGADLEDIRGMDNTEDTAELGKLKIINALTHDNRFNKSDIEIEAVPTNKDEITYYIFINLGYKKPLVIPYVVSNIN
ncbi:MAG: hypothetical protein ACOCRO_02195 [Halanaerobiales bacterium]